MKKRKNAKYTMTIIVTASILFLAGMGLLFHLGIIQFNHPSRDKYPVRGIDVSEYQGEVDWALLSSQDIDFAFIKATEGSKYVDPCFPYNWEHAGKTELRIGAYHFFSFDSPGLTQAENYNPL